jgi:hypothetical protein
MRRRWKRRLLWATALTGLLVLAIPATVAQASVAVRSVVERRGIMRKLIPLAALLALAAIIGSGTFASASSTGGAQTLTLVAVDLPKTERYVDVGAKGDSPGDTIFLREMLIQNAKKVGGSEVMCVFWVGNAGRCHGTLRLGRSTLEASGGIHFGGTFSLPVVGGTGSYAGARGVLRVTAVSEKRSRYDVELTG